MCVFQQTGSWCLDLPTLQSHAGLLQPGLLSVPSHLFTPTKAFVTLQPRTKLGVGDIILCAVRTSGGLIGGTFSVSLLLFFADSSSHLEILLPLETSSPNHLLRTESFATLGMSGELQKNFLVISYFLWSFWMVLTCAVSSSPIQSLANHFLNLLNLDSPRTFCFSLFTLVKSSSCQGHLLGDSCSYLLCVDISLELVLAILHVVTRLILNVKI